MADRAVRVTGAKTDNATLATKPRPSGRLSALDKPEGLESQRSTHSQASLQPPVSFLPALSRIAPNHRRGSPGNTPTPETSDGFVPGQSYDFASLPILDEQSRNSPPETEGNVVTIARTPMPLASSSGDETELHLTEPDEPEEIEADRFASAAMRATSCPEAAAPSPASVSPATLPALSPPTPAPVQAGKSAENGLEEESEATPDTHKNSPGAAPGAGEGDGEDGDEPMEKLQSANVGTPLGAALRSKIEPLVGVDLSRVRIHADAESAALSDRFQARAFAHQRDIFFGPGEYAPGSRSGLQLLLHEIAHVVQQSQQRPAPGLIARGPLSGRGVHKKLENILLDKHTDLIAEGVLPAGNANGTHLDDIGYPDLYRSSSGNKVPWVRGEYQDDGTLRYIPMKLGVGHAHPRGKAGKSGHEPTVDGSQTFTGDFPNQFAIAEIKPIGLLASALEKIGEGIAQSNNYIDGFRAFAKQAKSDGRSSVIPAGSSLTTVKNFLPPAIDYNNFVADAANKSPASPNMVEGKRRYWVYPYQKHPVLFYFDLPHPYAVTSYTEALNDLFTVLEGLKRGLGRKQPQNKVKLKSRSSRYLRRRRMRIARKTYWPAEHKLWEDSRKDWDEKKAKPFLKTDTAKAIEEKAKIDKKIGFPASADPEGAERSRRFRQVQLFSGETGKILGDIRYALAPLFDKIEPFFEWLKKKFNALIGKLNRSGTFSASWIKTVYNAVLAALKTTFQEAVSLLFEKFQDCIMGMIDNFIQSFERDLTEKLHEPYEQAKKTFLEWLGMDEQSFGKLQKDIEESLKKYEEIVEAITDVKRMIDEVQVYEFVIRGIVQIISCLSPPAAGCLWGLAAQIGFPAAVSLAATSDLFQNQVVRPLARDLLKDILDEPFSRIVSASMEAIGLGEWAKDVPACNIEPINVNKLLDRAVEPGLQLGDPELMKKRDAWSKQNEKAILDEAAKKFVHEGGKPVTPEELKKLLEQAKDLLPQAGNLKDALEGAKRKDGKIDFEKVSQWANGWYPAIPRTAGGGGFSSDIGGTPSPDLVKGKLDNLDLTKASPTRMVEILEDSRDSNGQVNLDLFADKMKMHLQRQQIKRDIDAKYPETAENKGVVRQPDREFADASGAEPGKDAMRELVESLAKANLGETSAKEKVQAARRAGGKVDVSALKSVVDTAGAGGSSGSYAPPASSPVNPPGPSSAEGGPGTSGSGKPEEKKPDVILKGPLRDTGKSGFPFEPVEVGPQQFGGAPGEGGSTFPGFKINLPELGPKKKP